MYCEIHPPSRTVQWIRDWTPKGIILSGGPNSVYGENVPTADPALLDLGTPVLGLCYGMQVIAQLAGGRVQRADRREYGRENEPFEYQSMSGDAFSPDGVRKLEDIGVQEAIVAFRNPYKAEPDHRTLDEMIGQLHWFADTVIAKV